MFINLCNVVNLDFYYENLLKKIRHLPKNMIYHLFITVVSLGHTYVLFLKIRFRGNGLRSRENGLIIRANGIRSRENGLINRANGIRSRENGLINRANEIRSRENELIIHANRIRSRENG